MVSINDMMTYGLSKITGKNVDIRLVDFPLVHPRAPNPIKARYRDFRDQLSKMITMDAVHSRRRNRGITYIFEIIWSDIIDDVVQFNDYFSDSDEYPVIFICLDSHLTREQEIRLRSRYSESFVFRLYNESIDEHNIITLQHFRSSQSTQITGYNSLLFEWNFQTFVERCVCFRNSPSPYYPLLLHVNSISSGLVFNYYYSYLNRQVGSTNNIFLDLTFHAVIPKGNLPQMLLIVVHTLIESVFLRKTPSSTPTGQLVPMQSNHLRLNADMNSYKVIDGWKTEITFCVYGVSDFGDHAQKVHIWQEDLPLYQLRLIQLRDDVRKWKVKYEPCSSDDSDEIDAPPLATFYSPTSPTRKCYVFPMTRAPTTLDRYKGVSTMKKTSKDTYDRYITDETISFGMSRNKIKEIRIAPVYYLLTKSSCDCGRPDTGGWQESQAPFPEGIIRDPMEPDRIHLAYAHNQVLQSPEMEHYNRYLRRTYYYIDVSDDNNEIIRYLFCAEYPYILSILDQMYQIGQITQAQKRNEYMRFCNMLQRLIDLDPWPDSIRLIQFDDEQYQPREKFSNYALNILSYADVKPFWQQIIEDIDEYYEPSPTTAAALDINTTIIPDVSSKRLALFCTAKGQEDPSITALITDLKQKLEEHDYEVDLTNNHRQTGQSIFICTGRKDDLENRQMMLSAQYNIIQRDTMRDVFILVNEAIEKFPCEFIRALPYLTVDLHHRTPQWNENDIREVINYLNKMNILSKDYSGLSEHRIEFDQESTVQCTSVGVGCAAAFYFNYTKLITSIDDHQYRLAHIEKELKKEYDLKNESNEFIFIRKWLFILPWTIENSTQLIPSILALTEEEQRMIGFKLTAWRPGNATFSHIQLTITVGGVFQRSYSPLMIYQLTSFESDQTIYFPMELPAALHGLQNQYQCILSRFNFGRFDPVEQARVFRENVFEYQSRDCQAEWHKHIILIPIDEATETPFKTAQLLLPTIWNHLTSSTEHNNTQ